MTPAVEFDALPASVRAALVEARSTFKKRESKAQSLLLGWKARGGTLFGLSLSGVLVSPVAVLVMWFWAGGPLDAAEELPVPLALVSLWFFAAIAAFVHDVRRSGVQAMVSGTYIYAGTMLVVDEARVQVFELAPGMQAEKVTSRGVKTSNVYQGGRRYIKTESVSADYLHIRGATTSGEPVELSFGARPINEEREVVARFNERFARWAHARQAGDFRTMASLDPFTECYATGRLALEPRDPAGPKMGLVGMSAAIPLYAAAVALAAVPLIVGLALA